MLALLVLEGASRSEAAGYANTLKTQGIIASMSRKGNCWDNAPMAEPARRPWGLHRQGTGHVS